MSCYKENLKFIVLFFCILIVSCKNDLEKEILRKINAEGRLEAEYQIDKNGQINGFYKEFFSDSSIKIHCFYKHNILDSNYVAYFPNGNIAVKKYYYRDSLFGQQYYYYPNGQLQKYAVVDGFGDVIYVLKYDSLGNEVFRDGNLLSHKIFCDKCDNGKLKKGQKIMINFSCSTPPNTTIEIFYGEIKNPIGKISKEEKLEVYANNIVPYDIIYDEVGKYEFYFRAILRDSDNNIISRDSVINSLLVIQ